MPSIQRLVKAYSRRPIPPATAPIISVRRSMVLCYEMFESAPVFHHIVNAEGSTWIIRLPARPEQAGFGFGSPGSTTGLRPFTYSGRDCSRAGLQSGLLKRPDFQGMKPCWRLRSAAENFIPRWRALRDFGDVWVWTFPRECSAAHAAGSKKPASKGAPFAVLMRFPYRSVPRHLIFSLIFICSIFYWSKMFVVCCGSLPECS